MRPGGSQDAVDRPARARQPLCLQAGIARQVVQDRLRPRRPLQALWWLITHLDDALNHRLTDALGRMLTRPRATVQHLLVFRFCLLQALLPFLDPPQRHAHGLGILLVRPLRMQSHQTTQIGAGCIVYYFHDGTSLLYRMILQAVYRSSSFLRKATMLGHTSGYEVGYSYSAPCGCPVYG
jgi:hypothetical protein